MLQTRLWMGTLLIALAVGVLLFDRRLTPWNPFLYLLLLSLGLLACHELVRLFAALRPWPWLCYLAVFALISANWPAHLGWGGVSWQPLDWVLSVYAGVLLLAFLVALRQFTPPESSQPDPVVRIALVALIAGYLGVLPSFLAQLCWPRPHPPAGDPGTQATLALALAIFVPKGCDMGAYAIGRLLGRHRMTPVLSPAKTWEGLAGGMGAAVLVAVGLNALGPVLPGEGARTHLLALGFGLTVGLAAVLGDLAESLIKRQYHQKDSSQAIPGFGGVLDVVDSVVFAAPVAYWWLA